MHGGAWCAAVHGVVKSWIRLRDFIFTFTLMHWRRKWQPTPGFLPGESQGRGSLVGCHLWGPTESEMTKVTQQQQQHCLFQSRFVCVCVWRWLGEEGALLYNTFRGRGRGAKENRLACELGCQVRSCTLPAREHWLRLRGPGSAGQATKGTCDHPC